MKRKLSAILLFSCFALVSCKGNSGGSNEQHEITPEPTISTFAKAFEKLQSSNISFESEVFAVQKSIETNEEFRNSYATRKAYFDDGKYSLEAFENNVKISEVTHFKDANGFAASRHLNIRNELVESPLAQNGKLFKWDNSVYYNLFQDLRSDQFKKVNENTYEFSVTDPNFKDWPTYIATSLTHMTSFIGERMVLTLGNDLITDIKIYDKDFHEPGDIYTYHNEIEAKVTNVGTVEVALAEAYPHDAKNDPLKIAIDEMKKATSYTTTLSAYSFLPNGISSTSSINSQTFITPNDIYKETIAGDGVKKVEGYHGRNGGYGIFNDDLDLNGNAILAESDFVSNSNVKSLMPTFNFSEDIFKFSEKKPNGDLHFRLKDKQLVDVLGEVTIEESKDNYIGQIPVTLVVDKDNHLKSLIYDSSGLEAYYKYEIKFSNLNTTVVDQNLFKNYAKRIPVDDYKDTRLSFSFVDGIPEGNKFFNRAVTFDEFFTTGLGANYNLPFYKYFNPSRDDYNGCIAPLGNYGDFAILTTLCLDIRGLADFTKDLEAAGTKLEIPTGSYYSHLYKVGEAYIGYMQMDEKTVMIEYHVPSAPFLA